LAVITIPFRNVQQPPLNPPQPIHLPCYQPDLLLSIEERLQPSNEFYSTLPEFVPQNPIMGVRESFPREKRRGKIARIVIKKEER